MVTHASEKAINLNSGVLDNNKITNQAIMDFGTNSITLGGVVFDAIEKRSGNRFLAGMGAFWVHWGWFWNAHEFGHGTRKSAMGIPTTFKPKYTYNFPQFFLETLLKPVNPSQNNLWAATTGLTSELAYELEGDNPYLTYSGSGANRIYTRTNRGKALIAGAGFANDTQWTETLGEQIYLNNAVHVSSTISYTLSKLLPVFYTSAQGAGDLEEISDSAGVSQGAIKTASLLSLALSTTTYNMWQSMTNGQQYVKKQDTIKSFRMPDVSTYFTHGISYKINSGYSLNDKTYIPLAFESVLQGSLQKQTEFTIGAVHQLNDKTTLDGRVLYNLNRKGLSLTSKISRQINDKTTAYISAYQYDINTMYGERNTTDFRKQKATSIYAGIQIKF